MAETVYDSRRSERYPEQGRQFRSQTEQSMPDPDSWRPDMRRDSGYDRRDSGRNSEWQQQEVGRTGYSRNYSDDEDAAMEQPAFSRNRDRGSSSPRGGPEPLGKETKSKSWLGSALGAVDAMVRSVSHQSAQPPAGHGAEGQNIPEQAPSRDDDEADIQGPGLKVFCEMADNLRIADFMGKSDPYCKVELRDPNGVTKKRKETKYIEQTLEPVWNQLIEFKKYELGDELFIEVWDKDFMPFNSDDLLGKVHLDANTVALGFDDWKMLDEAGDTQGAAKIKLRVVPPHNY